MLLGLAVGNSRFSDLGDDCEAFANGRARSGLQNLRSGLGLVLVEGSNARASTRSRLTTSSLGGGT